MAVGQFVVGQNRPDGVEQIYHMVVFDAPQLAERMSLRETRVNR